MPQSKFGKVFKFSLKIFNINGAVVKVQFPIIANGVKQSRILNFNGLLRLLRNARNDVVAYF